MPLTIHLLGRPRLEVAGAEAYRFRSQKSWGLLAYLLLADHLVSRAQVAQLLFESADDPLRALRWSLNEIRRGLGDGGTVEGDPIRVTLPPGVIVDVDVVTRGTWRAALDCPGLGQPLLSELTARVGYGFDVWLATERRRLAAASEAILHEAALGLMSQGDIAGAVEAAQRAVALNPLDEDSQALLIRLHRQSGDAMAARESYDAVRILLRDELGVEPSPAVEMAWREEVPTSEGPPSRASVEAVLEAGSAAIAAGAVLPGMSSLRAAVDLADASGQGDLRIRTRVVLAESLVHSVRGRDEEGIACLHAADALAREVGDRSSMARIRTELGYVDFLRARYDRADHWLSDALAQADDDPEVVGLARTYLGGVDSDRAEYARARAHLDEGVAMTAATGDTRRQAYALALVGRIHLLRGELEDAEHRLRESMALCDRDRWLTLMPWPQALLGEALLAAGEASEAEGLIDQAFARACQLGDPCWEGTAARALALIADSKGDPSTAFERLHEARSRSNRVTDAYVWLDAYILDVLCTLGVRHGHPDAARWIEDLQHLAQRTDMREMTVRALVHGAALGSAESAEGARLLARAIDNPALHRLVDAELGG